MMEVTAAASDSALCVAFGEADDSMIVTGGFYTLRKWKIDEETKKLSFVECNMSKLRRVFTSLALSSDDTFLYAGTHTGDVFKILMNPSSGTPIVNKASGKPLFQMGVKEVQVFRGFVYVGTGSGTLAKLSQRSFKTLERIQLGGGVTSIATHQNLDEDVSVRGKGEGGEEEERRGERGGEKEERKKERKRERKKEERNLWVGPSSQSSATDPPNSTPLPHQVLLRRHRN